MNNREKNIDSLRTLCALFVISVHICAPYLSANLNVFNTTFGISSSIKVFARVAVPVFVLIDGLKVLRDNQKIIIKESRNNPIGKGIYEFIKMRIIYRRLLLWY